MKIKTKLVLSFTAILLLFALTVFFIVYFRVSGVITQNYQSSIKSNANLSLAFFDERFPGEWEIKDNILYKGELKINDSTEFVDTINTNSGYLATIFMKDTRVSTNVLLEDGKRAIGTKASDEVINTVLKEGIEYHGQAVVAKKNAFTYYTPLKNGKGEIVGMWFVGIGKTVVDSQIRNIVGTIGLVIIFSLFIGALIAYYVGNRLSKVIIVINKHLDKFSNGDFSDKIFDDGSQKSTSELGQILRSTNTMQESIKGIIKTIMKESNTIENTFD